MLAKPIIASGWTEERVERLKTLWTGGESASRIAADLGGVSRNAVIGKVHRLGLAARATAVQKKKPSRAAARADGTHKAVVSVKVVETVAVGNLAMAVVRETAQEEGVKPAPREDVLLPLAQPLTLMQLGPSTCRWPLGDPRTEEFRFCGMPVSPGRTYCAQHSCLAYEKRESRALKKPALPGSAAVPPARPR